MNTSPKKLSYGFYTPQRVTRSATRLTASTTKAKQEAARLALSEEQSESLVLEMEQTDTDTTEKKKKILQAVHEKRRAKKDEEAADDHAMLTIKRSNLASSKLLLVLEIEEATKCFSKLEGAVAVAEEEDDESLATELKGQLAKQKSYLYSIEMRLNLVNYELGAVIAELAGKGIIVLEESDFINLGAMALDQAQAVFGGSSFASDIQTYASNVMANTGEAENVVLSNILVKMKNGNLAMSHEFQEMFKQFSGEAMAVLGRSHREANGTKSFAPAIRTSKQKLGFNSVNDSMLWRITMYLDLEWDLDETVFVPDNLRNPFRAIDIDGDGFHM